jgi:hypothetical protein
VKRDGHVSGIEILIGVLSIANICLLVASIFYRGRTQTEEIDSREKLGLVAVFFGLSSQVFYLLIGPWAIGWMYLDRDSVFRQLHVGFPSVGLLLSAASFFAAWFGRGVRRYASLWVGSMTGVFWMLASFALLFGPS